MGPHSVVIFLVMLLGFGLHLIFLTRLPTIMWLLPTNPSFLSPSIFISITYKFLLFHVSLIFGPFALLLILFL